MFSLCGAWGVYEVAEATPTERTGRKPPMVMFLEKARTRREQNVIISDFRSSTDSGLACKQNQWSSHSLVGTPPRLCDPHARAGDGPPGQPKRLLRLVEVITWDDSGVPRLTWLRYENWTYLIGKPSLYRPDAHNVRTQFKRLRTPVDDRPGLQYS